MPPTPPDRILAGAMSGTSADGVDIALTRIRGRGLAMTADLIHHHARPYDPSLRQRIFAVRGSGTIDLAELAGLGREISLAYAAAVNDALREAHLTANDLAAVAAHGQTLFHDPPNTIQWLDPALLAAEVGCPVVSDFRRADCAAGGQGAPLVPFADFILFQHPEKNRVLLNLGGIANLTHLPAGGSIGDVTAFDTGPGNCVSDWLCRTYDPNGPGFDLDGNGAAAGRIHYATAMVAVRSPYVFRHPPKSTDGPEMIAVYRQAKVVAACPRGSLHDELATACAFSAWAIKMSLDTHIKGLPRAGVDEVLVSGGGTRNVLLMRLLHEFLTERGLAVFPLDEERSKAKEALAFALLGAATLDNEPSNVPSATGAKRRVVLGSITPKP